jgi:hypothetical protein
MTANTSTANNTENTETLNSESPAIDVNVVSDNNTSQSEAPANKVTTELPNATEFAAMLQISEALNSIRKLKGMSDSDAAKQIDKMKLGEALTVAHLVLSPTMRGTLKAQLGDTTSAYLIHTVCTKVQLATYEADDTARLQTLGNEDDGHGLYIQQAPLGGLGCEFGFVKRDTDDGKANTNRAAVGAYIRSSKETRPVNDAAETADLAKAFDRLFA